VKTAVAWKIKHGCSVLPPPAIISFEKLKSDCPDSLREWIQDCIHFIEPCRELLRLEQRQELCDEDIRSIAKVIVYATTRGVNHKPLPSAVSRTVDLTDNGNLLPLTTGVPPESLSTSSAPAMHATTPSPGHNDSSFSATLQPPQKDPPSEQYMVPEFSAQLELVIGDPNDRPFVLSDPFIPPGKDVHQSPAGNWSPKPELNPRRPVLKKGESGGLITSGNTTGSPGTSQDTGAKSSTGFPGIASASVELLPVIAESVSEYSDAEYEGPGYSKGVVITDECKDRQQLETLSADSRSCPSATDRPQVPASLPCNTADVAGDEDSVTGAFTARTVQESVQDSPSGEEPAALTTIWPQPEPWEGESEWSNWDLPAESYDPNVPTVRELLSQGRMPFARPWDHQPLRYAVINWPDGTTTAGVCEPESPNYPLTLTQMDDGTLRWDSRHGIDNMPYAVYFSASRWVDSLQSTFRDATETSANTPDPRPVQMGLLESAGMTPEKPGAPQLKETNDVPEVSHSVPSGPKSGAPQKPAESREDPNIRYIYDTQEAAELIPIDFDKVGLSEVVDDGTGQDPDEGMVSDTLGFER